MIAAEIPTAKRIATVRVLDLAHLRAQIGERTVSRLYEMCGDPLPMFGADRRLEQLATELEAQTIRWIAELLGYPTDCGGLLVSGGNMANFVGFLAARAAQATWDVRADGLAAVAARRTAPRVGGRYPG